MSVSAAGASLVTAPVGAGASPTAPVAWASLDTPIGPLVLGASRRGLCYVGFGGPDGPGDALDELARRSDAELVEDPARLDPARHQLDEYFAGRRRSFDLALDRSLSQGFRATVLRELERVPFGATVSYADLAAAAGSPRAFRAVGSAMATNPIAVVVPCHRVLRTGGGLGGYGGGLHTKRWLLAHEGAPGSP